MGNRLLKVGSCVIGVEDRLGDVVGFVDEDTVRVRWHGEGFPIDVDVMLLTVVRRPARKVSLEGIRIFGKV